MSASGHRYIVLVIVLAGIFMAVLDGMVVAISLPTITESFGVSVSDAGWVMTSYLLTMTCFLLIFSKISDYTGKPLLFISGLAVFTAASLGCGVSSSLPMLIFFRIIQALGAAMVYSISTAILADHFPQREIGKALGLVGTTVAIGGIAGPAIGGFIVGTLGWPYVFWLNVPIGIGLVALSLVFLKDDKKRIQCERFDIGGSISLVIMLSSLLLLVNDLSGGFRFSTMTAVYVIALVLSLLGFIKTESRHPCPIVDMKALRVNRFIFASSSAFLNFVAMFVFNFITPFYLQYSAGYGPFEAGQAMILVPLAVAVTSPVSGFIFNRLKTSVHSTLGMVIMASAFFILGYIVHNDAISLLLPCFVLLGFGNGLFQSPNDSEVMSALPAEKSGMASGVLATVRNLGMSIGVSLAGILLSMGLMASGFMGFAFEASPSLLSSVIGGVMAYAGLICIIAAILSLFRK